MSEQKLTGTINEEGQIVLDSPLTRDRNSRVEVTVRVINDVSEDLTQAEVLADFQQAWEEAMTGKTIPVSQLWEGWEHD
ncbi:MAG: hypothetical protein SAJ12_12575 [Jaaginema sp. PMC 1079.18]|nr:hypothetical protein [Jaaginema sp. PMC 1080.18]MEC4851841.1 hypothetical protein [Jaaginema sp. PMC 1079.18]MEC4865210.1 hypothetical protein [Jaaginema sp. PMC 1078.18]